MTQQHTGTALDVFNSGPSVFNGGAFPQDARNPVTTPNPSSDDPYLGFFPIVKTVDAVPSAIATNNLATVQVPVAATPLTLTAGTGITSSGGNFYIDGIPAANPTTDISKLVGRNVRITSVGNDSSATASVLGIDIYGVVMHETLTLTNASVVSGKKAFKAITSITPAGTLSGSNVSVGTGDVYGFPMRSDFFSDGLIFWNTALITATTGYLAAVTTDPATATTGDVRGTYAVQSASDATKRLIMYQTYKSFTTVATMFGVTQF